MKQVGIIMMGSGDTKKINDVIKTFGEDIKVHVKGIVDGYTYEYIKENLWPRGNESFIVSKIQGNKSIMVSTDKALELVNLKIREFEDCGVNYILIFCTGHFENLKLKGFVVIPEDIIYGILQGLGIKKVGIIVPEEEQISDSLRQYSDFKTVIKAASPYKDIENLRIIAEKFREEDVELILTDCMGFNEEMGKVVREASGKNVIVPRVFIPNIMKSLI